MKVVVVGGGVAGLAAALRLRERVGPELDLTVVEQAERLGGKLNTVELAGAPVESGAESFLVRRPEALDLAHAVGLGEELLAPRPFPSALALPHGLVGLPRRTVMGIPADGAAAAEVLDAAARDRVDAEPVDPEPLLGPEDDVGLGRLVRSRLGDQVVDRLVDPLLGGVYAGRSEELSLETVVPNLARELRRTGSLTAATRALLPPEDAPVSTAPVFGTVEGGLSRLVAATAEAAGARLLLGAPARRLRRRPAGWEIELGPAPAPRLLHADFVVLAVPARPAARLVEETAPAAAAELARLEYASVALVGAALPGVDLPPRSGVLKPRELGGLVKAATFVDNKWPQVPAPEAGIVRVRLSLGRHGEERELQRDDSELAALALQELESLIGAELPPPAETRVWRWGGALPQYAPGHLARVRRARHALREHPIALAGAACDGVGVPACLASGRRAADLLSDRSTDLV